MELDRMEKKVNGLGWWEEERQFQNFYAPRNDLRRNLCTRMCKTSWKWQKQAWNQVYSICQPPCTRTRLYLGVGSFNKFSLAIHHIQANGATFNMKFWHLGCLAADSTHVRDDGHYKDGNLCNMRWLKWKLLLWPLNHAISNHNQHYLNGNASCWPISKENKTALMA